MAKPLTYNGQEYPSVAAFIRDIAAQYQIPRTYLWGLQQQKLPPETIVARAARYHNNPEKRGRQPRAITVNNKQYRGIGEFYEHISRTYNIPFDTIANGFRRELGPNYAAIEQRARELQAKRQAKNTSVGE